MHKKFGKDRICGSGDILADTQTCSSQYFTTAAAGEVNMYVFIKLKARHWLTVE